MHIKIDFVELKRRNQEVKRKKTRLPSIFFSLSNNYIFWWLFKIKKFICMTKITTKKFSVLIAYRKLKAILFFSSKLDKNCKIFNLFSSFEFEKIFFLCIFLNACLFLSFQRRNLFSRSEATYSLFNSFVKKILIDEYPTILILGPTYRFWALKSYFRLFDY
jgi:hypothetical protein